MLVPQPQAWNFDKKNEKEKIPTEQWTQATQTFNFKTPILHIEIKATKLRSELQI